MKNDRGDVQKLKHEIDQIKRKPQREEETELVKLRREMDELKNSMRDNRISRNYSGSFRGSVATMNTDYTVRNNTKYSKCSM